MSDGANVTGRMLMLAVLAILGALDRIGRILAESGKVESWTDSEDAEQTARLLALDKATRGIG